MKSPADVLGVCVRVTPLWWWPLCPRGEMALELGHLDCVQGNLKISVKTGCFQCVLCFSESTDLVSSDASSSGLYLNCFNADLVE